MLRVPLMGLKEGRHLLTAETSRYVVRVHRLSLGSTFVAFDPESALEAVATIADINRGVSVDVGAVIASSNVPRLQTIVIQCFAKIAKVDAVVRDATELGATQLIVAASDRSIRREPSEGTERRWQRITVEAARQAGRGDCIALSHTTSIEGALTSATQNHPGVQVIWLHPGADPLSQITVTTEPIVVVIGPEGGFSPAELSLAKDRGDACASIGAFTLRTETACAAVLGALSVLRPYS